MRRTIALAALLAVTGACSKKGGSSPQDVYDKAKAASEKKDWKTLYNTFDPQEQESLILGVYFGSAFACMGNKDAATELEAIGTKHGVAKDQKDEAKAKESMKAIKDKEGLFVDLMNFLQKHARDSKGNDTLSFTGQSLKDVKIDGDKATGVITKADGKDSKISFVKRDGRWYITAD